MKQRKDIKTTSTEVVQYWQAHMPDYMISVEWEDASDHCWRCGRKQKLQRCHIIPDSQGGTDEPSNFVLLCKTCHAEGPNVSDPDIMWDWIAAYSTSIGNLYWIWRGFKEYEFIYGKTVEQEISDIMAQAQITEMTDEQNRKYVYDAMKQTSKHFGQTYPNAATVAGAYRIMLKSIANDYGVHFPII